MIAQPTIQRVMAAYKNVQEVVVVRVGLCPQVNPLGIVTKMYLMRLVRQVLYKIVQIFAVELKYKDVMCVELVRVLPIQRVGF